MQINQSINQSVSHSVEQAKRRKREVVTRLRRVPGGFHLTLFMEWGMRTWCDNYSPHYTAMTLKIWIFQHSGTHYTPSEGQSYTVSSAPVGPRFVHVEVSTE